MTGDTPKQPNVLFIVMDTARYADVFSSGPVVMPKLQEIASEGATFQNAFANAPWTVPSHGSMFTGQYPSDHGAHAGTKRFVPDTPAIAELFQKAGYRTGAFSNNTWLSPAFGFHRGFETFQTRWELFEGGSDLAGVAKAEGIRGKFRALLGTLADREVPLTIANFIYAASLSYRSTEDSGAHRTTGRVIDWLDAADNRPFFGFVNYVEPHLQYDPPAEYRERFLPEGMAPERLDHVNQDPWGYLAGEVEMSDRDFEALLALYRAELRYLDTQIERLYEQIERDDILDETAIVVVGDHGENIGEHGLMDHQYCLYDTLMHVPCVIRYPAAFASGTHVTGLVELRDLFPTLLELINFSIPEYPDVSTNSLAHPTEQSIGREYVVAEYLAPQPSMTALSAKVRGELPKSVRRYDRALRALRTDRWKYIEGSDESCELYDLSVDPAEHTDVPVENPVVVDQLGDRLAADRGPFTPPGETTGADVDAMTERRLENLGYLQ